MAKENPGIDMSVGFMGAGGLSAALVKGLCASDLFKGRIAIYNSSPEKTRVLYELYPEKIVVAESNQDVLNGADIVFPALLPEVLRQVAPTLRFRKENRVVHVAAGIDLAEANPWYIPARSVVRAVPLPFAAERIGPVVLYGNDVPVHSLLSLIGSVVAVSDERSLEILAAVTGMMAPYYALVGETVKWGMAKGADFGSVLDYTTSMDEALSAMMRKNCGEDIDSYVEANVTPNGMNEMGLRMMKESGAYDAWRNALESIGSRYGL